MTKASQLQIPHVIPRKQRIRKASQPRGRTVRRRTLNPNLRRMMRKVRSPDGRTHLPKEPLQKTGLKNREKRIPNMKMANVLIAESKDML